MPPTRFEECWPLPKESLPKLPWNLNIITLTLTLYPIKSRVLKSLLLPHLSSSQTPCFPWNSYATQQLMLDSCIKKKAVWSIPYGSVAFYPRLKHNSIAYRSSKVSSRPDCVFEIHQLWQSGFSREYPNSCSCSFEPEIIKIIQSIYKMYSTYILHFEESTLILNACTKEVWKLIECTTYNG